MNANNTSANAESPTVTKEQLIHDFKVVVSDAEALLKATAGQGGEALAARLAGEGLEVVAVESIVDLLKFHMTRCGAYEVKDRGAVDSLERLLLGEDGRPKTEWVGKSAEAIARAAGLEPPAGVRLLIVETSKDHPFVVHELMMPVIGLVRVPDVNTAIDLACELEHGNRHTAIMHSRDVTKLTKMARLIQTTIFVKNGPSYAGIGIGGEGFSTFTIAGPTGEGLTSARSFARKRRCVLVGDLNVR